MRTPGLIAAALLGLLGLLGLERPARACGYWMLDDLELGVRIVSRGCGPRSDQS